MDIVTSRAEVARLRKEKNKAIAALEAALERLRGGGGDAIEIEEDDSENGLPFAIVDKLENIFRCTECGWEVIEGRCHYCETEHVCIDENGLISDSGSDTENAALSLDRSLFPSPPPSPQDITSISELREYERKQLLARGASREMIERYKLSFTTLHGIYAWADQALFDEFAGPGMARDDNWKIYLGRRIKRDKNDLDGRTFIEGLIEDALLFPQPASLVDPTSMEWRTTQERAGEWVTKPHVLQHDEVKWDKMYTEENDSDADIPQPDLSLIYEAEMEMPADPLQALIVDEYISDNESNAGSEGKGDGFMSEDETSMEADWSFHPDLPDAGYGEDNANMDAAEGDLIEGYDPVSDDSFDSDFASDDSLD